jgi:hypothetical protein
MASNGARTVKMSERALKSLRDHAPSKLLVAGSSPAGVATPKLGDPLKTGTSGGLQAPEPQKRKGAEGNEKIRIMDRKVRIEVRIVRSLVVLRQPQPARQGLRRPHDQTARCVPLRRAGLPLDAPFDAAAAPPRSQWLRAGGDRLSPLA